MIRVLALLSAWLVDVSRTQMTAWVYDACMHAYMCDMTAVQEQQVTFLLGAAPFRWAAVLEACHGGEFGTKTGNAGMPTKVSRLASGSRIGQRAYIAAWALYNFDMLLPSSLLLTCAVYTQLDRPVASCLCCEDGSDRRGTKINRSGLVS